MTCNLCLPTLLQYTDVTSDVSFALGNSCAVTSEVFFKIKLFYFWILCPNNFFFG